MTLSRSLEESEQLVRKFKKEKNEWQELYLQVAPGKRPAEAVRSDPPNDKRFRRNEGGDRSRQSSSVEAVRHQTPPASGHDFDWWELSESSAHFRHVLVI